MEFWLTYNDAKQKLQLPVNPPEFEVETSTMIRKINIINIGELALIGKEKSAIIQFSSFFPFSWGPYCEYVDIPGPYEAVEQIDTWKKSGKPVRLIITETPVNMPCVIEEFTWKEKGGTRDVEYTLALCEYRFVIATLISETAAVRPNEKPTPKSYVVKKGDSLSLVSKRVYGDSSRWKIIYDANKALIGPDPTIIQVGWELIIP